MRNPKGQVVTTASGERRDRFTVANGQTMLEKRSYERVAFFSPLKLAVLPSGPIVPAKSCDASIGGVGIAAPVALERGQMVRVQFYLRNGSEDTAADRVAYCLADNGSNRISIEFLEPIRPSTQPVLSRKLNAS
jgi:hypothetical protein